MGQHTQIYIWMQIWIWICPRIADPSSILLARSGLESHVLISLIPSLPRWSLHFSQPPPGVWIEDVAGIYSDSLQYMYMKNNVCFNEFYHFVSLAPNICSYRAVRSIHARTPGGQAHMATRMAAERPEFMRLGHKTPELRDFL